MPEVKQLQLMTNRRYVYGKKKQMNPSPKAVNVRVFFVSLLYETNLFVLSYRS